MFLNLLLFFASPLRAGVSAAAGILQGEDGVDCLRPSHCIDSRKSLRNHAFDYLTAPSLSLSLSCLLCAPPLLPTAPDQTHSDRGRDPEAQKQGKGIKLLMHVGVDGLN